MMRSMRGLGMCWVAALLGCGNGGGAHADANRIADAISDTAPSDPDATIDAPQVLDFSCVGKPAPTTATDPLVFAGTAYELKLMGATPTGVALDGAVVTGCRPGGDCATAPTQFGSATTPTTVGTAGSWALPSVASGGMPYDVYWRLSKTGDRTSLTWGPFPPRVSGSAIPLLVINSSAFALLTFGVGVNQQAQNGDLGLIVVDCTGTRIQDSAHIQLIVQQNGQDVQGASIVDLGANTSAGKGTYFVLNVPGGPSGSQAATTVGAIYSGVSPPIMFHQHTVGVVAGTSTDTVIAPGYY